MDINIAASEWSNGCESGWTGYFDESYITRNDNVGYSQSYRLNPTQNDDDNNDDDEDLSMVSDASSGPPHALVQEEDDDQHSYSRSIFCKNNANCCYSTNSGKSSKKSAKKSKKFSNNKEHEKVSSNNKHQHHHQQYHLDDTASSPAVSTHYQMYANPSNINMDFSQNFPATHFEGNSSYSNHYAFWQSSLVNETDYSAQPGHLSGRGWE